MTKYFCSKVEGSLREREAAGCGETAGDVGLLDEEVLRVGRGGRGETAGDGPLDADLRVEPSDLDGCFRREGGDFTVASSSLLVPGLSRFFRFEVEDTDCCKSASK